MKVFELLTNSLNNNLSNIGIIVNTVPMSQKLYDDITDLYPDKQVLLYKRQHFLYSGGLWVFFRQKFTINLHKKVSVLEISVFYFIKV